MDYKIVQLDGVNYALPSWGYESIKRMVESYRICRKCELSFDESSRRETAQNLCLDCVKAFISDKSGGECKYIGHHKGYLKKGEYDQEEITHTLIMEEQTGYILTFASNEEVWSYGTAAHRDIRETLKFYKFFPPTLRDLSREKVEYDTSLCSILGAFRKNYVIALFYDNGDQKDGIRAGYLLYKNGGAILIPPKHMKGNIHKLAQEAQKRIIDKYLGEDGTYRIPNFPEEKRISAKALYAFMAEIESERYDESGLDATLIFTEGRML